MYMGASYLMFFLASASWRAAANVVDISLHRSDSLHTTFGHLSDMSDRNL